MIKAIIFDFDGLIIDTETAWYKAHKEVWAKLYDVELPLEIWAKAIGTSSEVYDPMKYLEEKAAVPVDRTRVHQEAAKVYKLLMKDQDIRPGVRTYLQEASQMGLKIALASSSTREWVESYLTQFDLISYFQSINTSDIVKNVKPDPELYLKAISALQVEGHEAIAFEDSLNGLEAAKAAGVHCVVVPNTVTSFMDFAIADLRIQSMADQPLKDVIQQVAGSIKEQS